VKLLIDENPSPRLRRLLADAYPESAHVRDVGLRGADDHRRWMYARDKQRRLFAERPPLNRCPGRGERPVALSHPATKRADRQLDRVGVRRLDA
jgi:hypothetical protein